MLSIDNHNMPSLLNLDTFKSMICFNTASILKSNNLHHLTVCLTFKVPIITAAEDIFFCIFQSKINDISCEIRLDISW